MIYKKIKDHYAETIYIKCLPRTLEVGKANGKQFEISYESFIVI